LGALNDLGELTRIGRKMSEFPLDPLQSKLLIESQKYKCINQIITITSMLEVAANLFYSPKDKQVHANNARSSFDRGGGDHIVLLNVFDQWKSTDYSYQWCFNHFIQYKSLKRVKEIRE